ncbi:TGS domain-containing protein [candidate division WOR-3 bacterium]|nr:TGS domain-containing protein [candidate division WOR-3 bacterium]
MPANLPQIYHKIEGRLKFAATPEEKIPILKEMLAVMPKHKGTDGLRAELNSKIAKLKKEAKKKPQARRLDMNYVPKMGIAQVVLMGPPNSGKSTLLSKLTNAEPEVASYPFTTQKPDVGMIEFENVQIQLVDTPPLYENFHPPWLLALGRSSDVIIGLIDGSKADSAKELDSLLSRLEEGLIFLESKDYYSGDELMKKNGFIIISRSGDRDLKLFDKKYSERLNFFGFDLDSDLEILKGNIYKSLNFIRIYTKPPGKEADFTEPVVLREGATVLDAAYHIHKDFADKMKYTKLWRGDRNPKQVGPEEVLMEGDVVEFHSR